MDSFYNGPWYHGSPLRLKQLRKGSVVTPFREVAKAFAHKPPRVSMSDNYSVVKHNGEVPGFLYVISEDVAAGDILEMPGTDSTHWVNQRNLQVELVCELPVSDPPLLTEEELAELRKDRPDGQTGFTSRKDDPE